MDVSDLRKQILRALDEARKAAVTRRASTDQAAGDYERFMAQVAVPLFRQAATVLRAEGHAFTTSTPAGSVRLSSDHASDDFVELELDGGVAGPQVLGRTSLGRGRRGLLVEERPVAPGKAISELTEDDVSGFLIAEIRRLVTRG